MLYCYVVGALVPDSRSYIEDICKCEDWGNIWKWEEEWTGSQTDYRSRLYDITASYLEGLEFSPRPGNKLSLGRFFAGF